jgi:hypothetical protein
MAQRVTANDYASNQQDALYRLICYSKSALRVSGDVFAHHQEHLTVFTVSGSVHPSCCRLATALLSPNSDGKPEAATAVVVAPDDGHKDARNTLSCI